MADLGWIIVNRWNEFQTYDTQRGSGPPPWIRTYTRLMRDDDYMRLPPNRVAILHRLWLEYASTSCQLRADTRELSRRLNLRVTVQDLKALNHAGFIEVVARNVSASGAQDERASRARGEVEVEVEEPAEQSRSKTTTTPGPASEIDSDNQDEPFATGPEPPPPLNGRTADEYGLQPLEVDVDELVSKWSEESA